jgi:seryl-tRNA synthetase
MHDVKELEKSILVMNKDITMDMVKRQNEDYRAEAKLRDLGQENNRLQDEISMITEDRAACGKEVEKASKQAKIDQDKKVDEKTIVKSFIHT